jgi:hypothetical protein
MGEKNNFVARLDAISPAKRRLAFGSARFT